VLQFIKRRFLASQGIPLWPAPAMHFTKQCIITPAINHIVLLLVSQSASHFVQFITVY